MDEDGSVRQAERREFARSDCLEQLVAGALPQKRQGASVSRDHLLVLDPRRPKRLLDAPAGVKPRSSVIAVADKERGVCQSSSPPTASAPGWRLRLRLRAMWEVLPADRRGKHELGQCAVSDAGSTRRSRESAPQHAGRPLGRPPDSHALPSARKRVSSTPRPRATTCSSAWSRASCALGISPTTSPERVGRAADAAMASVRECHPSWAGFNKKHPGRRQQLASSVARGPPSTATEAPRPPGGRCRVWRLAQRRSKP